ncbi:unnamed protein product [Adineta ricciae]|uniref:Uncharacterized protein n=1 Tax=Adineta ricciae TaxID=249248 RepID=A0A814VL64_ADIRI|nr:unnamed protein product [Adineta ricciae]
MQEHSYTLPMCSLDCTSHVPSATVNVSIDTHTSTTNLSNDIETQLESPTSTPELNLLLDKLTEILRFRSGCRRHFGVMQQQQTSQSPSTSNLKRLQSSSLEPLHNIADVAPLILNNSSIPTGAWKSSNLHYKTSISNRWPHHHHHHHHHYHAKHHANISTANEKKRRLPCLLQHLIDEGNLIKEAVRRLKSQNFSPTSKPSTNIVHTPSTPTTKPCIQTSSSLTSRLTPSASINIHIPQQLSDSSTQVTSSPNRSISWFLSSNVFTVNASTANHRSGSGSPLRSYYTLNTYDRAPMEIGIHDG